ncbi:MAG: NADAR family protein [Microscillaceae bacterium]|jgi:hypothetical protein|nr:NADAR family protein [Microscillaceae bacterium]
MNYNLQWLIEAYEQGEKLKYVFFWGHQPSADGSVTASCFSQWWQSAFSVEGIEYKTAEHWMMAGKAKIFGDEEIRQKIIATKTPAEAKKLGRAVKNFDPQIWDEHKYELVKQGNIYKFGQHADLKSFLLNTKDRILVETSPVDKIWGIGMAKTHIHIENPTLWKGQNLLGFALMEARDELSKQ